MLRFIALTAASVMLLMVMPAQAGNPWYNCDSPGCQNYLQAGKQAPYSGPVAPTNEPMACLTVLAPNPQPLVLLSGTSLDGPEVTRWRIQGWSQTSLGYKREICIPLRVLPDEAVLCGDIGHSTWRAHHIAQLRRQRRIPADDPACVGGDAWCAARGL